jgi:cardiolipin synthase
MVAACAAAPVMPVSTLTPTTTTARTVAAGPRLDPPSFFSIANLLSLARVPLALAFAVVLAAPWGGPVVALGVLAVAGLTDALDGMFARRAEARRLGTHGPTAPAGTGSWLDPVCDKVFVAGVLGAIWYRSQPSLGLLALIIARELAQLPLSLVYATVPVLRRWLRYDFRASVLGKAATVAQFVAIGALLFQSRLVVPAAWLAFAMGLLALGDYILRAIRIGRARLGQSPQPSAQRT